MFFSFQLYYICFIFYHEAAWVLELIILFPISDVVAEEKVIIILEPWDVVSKDSKEKF